MGGIPGEFEAHAWRAAAGASPLAGAWPDGGAGRMWSEYSFLIGLGADEAGLQHAIAVALRCGSSPHRVLIAEGRIDPAVYLSLLQAEIDRHWTPVPGTPTEVIDGLADTPANITAAAWQVRARGALPLLMTRAQIDWSEPQASREARAEVAANGLRRQMPAYSAARRFARWQVAFLTLAVGVTIGGLAVVPETALGVLAGLLTIPFLLIVGLRVLSLLVVLRLSSPWRQPQRIADAELPVYSILVPLFREAQVLPGLVQSLMRLDYPADKLDILLILESTDQETQAAARSLNLPEPFRIVVVPHRLPQTKPKALNYALDVARGDYVVVYDAEDDPEPDQLRRALAEFRRRPRKLMCVEARLAMDNPAPGLIARQFMLEYAALFDAMLPALVRLGLPVPLGGTSNHFPRAALTRLGGWDAWNVTEDADLGVRIARIGGRVAVLSSTTYEEAPDTLGVWMRQRTRWLKGFMLTWLVHMRSPVRLLRELGLVGFLGFNAFLGGIVLSALIHPIFVALLVWAVATGQLMTLPESLLGGTLLTLALFNLVGGYLSGMAIAALAAVRRGHFTWLPHVLLMPFYWLLISAAAYRAALQLIVDPYLWEKTPHAARSGGGRAGH